MFRLHGNIHGIYRSLVNETDDVFCMDFNPTDLKYPHELIQSSFEREVRYLTTLDYIWMPEVIEIESSNRRIYFKWYGNTCEQQIPTDYKEQLLSIVKDLDKEKVYKPSFYPKYFYVDNNNLMHAFTFYSACDYSEQPIGIDFYKPILNPDRLAVVEKLSIDGKLDVRLLIEKAFNEYIEWPDNPLPEIYRTVYGF